MIQQSIFALEMLKLTTMNIHNSWRFVSRHLKLILSALVYQSTWASHHHPYVQWQRFCTIWSNGAPNLVLSLYCRMANTLLVIYSSRLSGMDSQQWVQSTDYAGHSFRIGAATTTACRGIQDSTIKMLGYWQSPAYMLYIRTSRMTLCAVSKALVDQSC